VHGVVSWLFSPSLSLSLSLYFAFIFFQCFVPYLPPLSSVFISKTSTGTHSLLSLSPPLCPAILCLAMQVAAQALQVPLSSVFISETSTDKVPNASPTAASASSDMYGAAILDACRQVG
jgi:xanthine dehydrogenase/oxidase